MNLRQENEELREKLAEYEEILSKVLDGPFEEGEVQSDVFEGLVRLADGSIRGVNPKDLPRTLKPGTKVLCNKQMVIKVLPEPLQIKPKPVEFNFVKWEQIGGLKSQIQEIRDTIELPTKQRHLYAKYGLTPSRGIVLYGPPGCGKTMVAKAIASDFLKGQSLTKDSFIYLKGGEMLSPYIGVAENNIKDIFERARANFAKTRNRTVIFIDEAEAILPARGSRRSSDVETTIVPTFLSEMDGFEENSTLIILATNFLEQLDPAVIRPGRIDLSVKIARPNVEDLADIFRIYLKGISVKGNVTVLCDTCAGILASKPSSFISGAYVKSIVEKAKLLALKRELSGDDKIGLQLDDFIQVLDRI